MPSLELTDEMIDWFGMGEIDVRLLLRLGVVSPEFIIEFWNMEHSQ